MLTNTCIESRRAKTVKAGKFWQNKMTDFNIRAGWNAYDENRTRRDLLAYCINDKSMRILMKVLSKIRADFQNISILRALIWKRVRK